MRLMRVARTAALSGVILIGLSAAPVLAQSGDAGPPVDAPAVSEAPATEPQARSPQPPPGLFILPRQPQAAPAEPMAPRGCTYRENKLELMV